MLISYFIRTHKYISILHIIYKQYFKTFIWSGLNIAYLSMATQSLPKAVSLDFPEVSVVSLSVSVL